MTNDNGDIRNILNMIVDEYFNGTMFADIARNCLIQLLLVMIWRKVNLQIDKYKPLIINYLLAMAFVMFGIRLWHKENVKKDKAADSMS